MKTTHKVTPLPNFAQQEVMTSQLS